MTHSTPTPNSTTAVKLSGKQLTFDATDLTILHLLAEHKFLTTQQVAKFLHTEQRLFSSSVRIASRRLNNLHARHVITSRAERQVGGVRQGGSEPHIWHLAKTGHDAIEKLKQIETGAAKKVFKTPTYTFARHRIAINDMKLLFQHIAKRYDNVSLGDVLIEEKSWRSYTSRSGAVASLRPDMYTTTHRGDRKHHWFVEVDCNTESPVRIIAKCNIYMDYLLSTTPDDWCCAVFPAVLWVVPTLKRRNSLRHHIAQSLPKPPQGVMLFIVITPQELPALVAEGRLGSLQETEDD